MLSQANNNYGMVLCNRFRRYLGSVLHLFNCLRQLARLGPKKTRYCWEKLCEMLQDQLFPSPTTKKNVTSSTDGPTTWAADWILRNSSRIKRNSLKTIIHQGGKTYHSTPSDRLWRSSDAKSIRRQAGSTSLVYIAFLCLASDGLISRGFLGEELLEAWGTNF